MAHPEPIPDSGHRLASKLGAGAVLSLVIVSAVAFVVLLVLEGDRPGLDEADPGRRSEAVYSWDGGALALVNVTEEWGLDGWINGSDREASGGAVIADFNRDGAFDVVVAGGEGLLFLARSGGGFVPVDPGVGDTVAVEAGDLDLDGWVDVVFGRTGGEDMIVWGGNWINGDGLPELMEIPGGEPTSGLVIARLAGEGLPALLRLDYNGPDRLLLQGPVRSFHQAPPLPNSDRRSLAASVADVNGDGELDIWITRDVGWQEGGDSLLLGEQAGGFRDATEGIGAGLEIDGMGVTLADLNGDGTIDAYLSDLGDNEVLLGSATGFGPATDTGAARIRPPGSSSEMISSSWASGAADLNLDGVLDLVVANGGFAGPVANKVLGTRVQGSDPPALFLGLGDGRFADVWESTGLDWEGAGRGLALGDLDGDLDTDIVIVTRDHGLVVLRNDVTGPALAVRAAPGCLSTGGVVRVTGEGQSFAALLGGPTFLGRHAAEAIVGAGRPVEVAVAFPHQGTVSATGAGVGRELLTLDCGEG